MYTYMYTYGMIWLIYGFFQPLAKQNAQLSR